jgi:uncharacterized protein involved in exopolysaccharide biosynthesis
MNEEQDTDDEISLIDLFAVLWHRKAMIIVITLIAAIAVVIFAVASITLPSETSPLPNEYTPTALMLINNASSSGGSMSSMLSATGLGGLAGLAGVSTGSTFSDLAISLAGTNTMLDTVVDEFDLLTRYKIETPDKKAKSPRADSRKALKKKLTASYEETSGIFSINFTDTDPVFAQSVVNFCVWYLEMMFNDLGLDKNKIEKENLERNIENTDKEIQKLENDRQELDHAVALGRILQNIPTITLELNRIAMKLEAQRQVYTQLTVQLELLKVTMASETPIFQVLELAEVPDQKSGPSRGMICLIVTFAAAFFSVFLAFVMNAITNVRQDPEAMAKFKSTKRNKV